MGQGGAFGFVGLDCGKVVDAVSALGRVVCGRLALSGG